VSILTPTQGVVFPGSLVKANAELIDGKPQRISALEGKSARATLSINLPGLGDKSSVRVANPTDANVRKAIDTTTRYWLENVARKSSDKGSDGFAISSRMSFEVATAYSEQQVAVQLGVAGGKGLISGSTDVSVGSTSKKRVVYALYKQVFYTVSCNPPRRPSDLMGRKVTLDDVKREMTADEPPAYVQSVSYGRVVMLRMETSWSNTETDVQGALRFGSGATAKLDIKTKNKFKEILENSSITVVSIGGSAKAAGKVMDAKTPEALAEFIRKRTEFTKDNPPEPIAYTVLFLKDNRVAKMGHTTDYTEVNSKIYTNGYVEFVHKGAYVADFGVLYQEYVKGPTGKWSWVLRAVPWKGATAGKTKKILLPPATRNILVVGEVHVLINNKADIFREVFATTPRVTFTVTGTTLDARFTKVQGH
jgi:thiol-activated cytolysin